MKNFSLKKEVIVVLILQALSGFDSSFYNFSPKPECYLGLLRLPDY